MESVEAVVAVVNCMHPEPDRFKLAPDLAAYRKRYSKRK
jgi:hypothetical protein